MSFFVKTKEYPEPSVCPREVFRYAGCKQEDENLAGLLRECLDEARQVLSYRVCYVELPVTVTGNLCDFGLFSVESKDLVKNLGPCRKAILFAATVGTGYDRLIAKYSRISPAKAVIFHALGAERVEALCDVFCQDISREMGCGSRPRFSPGYGDLPLAVQWEVFSILDCTRKIGISLGDSLLMTPSKSVTAFMGLLDAPQGTDSASQYKCSTCRKVDCMFRGVL